MKRILSILLVFLYISSLAQPAAADYAIYVPKKSAARSMPVVFFFDPHGDGSLPLHKYQTLAEAYGFILVGSNLSKNGNDWPATQNIWNKLYSEIRQRLHPDENRVYVCGFSGGAKVAGYVAIQQPGIRGVIAGGAGLPDGVSASDFPFSYTALAGEGDMNLTELVSLNAALDRTHTRHRMIVFDGKHEWAPLAVMNRAFAGWQLEAMHDGYLARDAAFIGRSVGSEKKRAEAAIATGHLVLAEQTCRVATSFLAGLTPDAEWFKQKIASLAADPRYQKELRARDAVFAQEESIKSGYMQHFQQRDRNYWSQTIADLQKKAITADPQKAMYQRLLAYLSLAFYSLSNQQINAGRNEDAWYFVELYKFADPDNTEAWYFSAIIHARTDHAQAAADDLVMGATLGFRDRERMHKQPEFQKALSAAQFARIEEKMSK
jgi:pimeloyl-ACP methyl ester carboxylesterase